MNVLIDRSSFLGGTKTQYEQLFKIINDIIPESFAFKTAAEFSEGCLIRGGVFWSEKKKLLIPGKLQYGVPMKHREFITGLTNTLEKYKQYEKNKNA